MNDTEIDAIPENDAIQSGMFQQNISCLRLRLTLIFAVVS